MKLSAAILVLSSLFLTQSTRDLERAARARDAEGFLAALEQLLPDASAGTIRKALEAYAVLVGDPIAIEAAEFYRLHSAVARALSRVKETEAAEVKKLLGRAREWQARLAILDAAAFNPRLDLLGSALTALGDKHPAVIRRALSYLRNARELRVVDAVLERYLEVDRSGGSFRGDEWDRTRLAFRSALTALIKVSFPAAVDYRNYLSSRRDSPDLFDPPEARGEGNTRLSLFGTEVTGKNIAFVIDVSGSMMATDPIVIPEDRNPGKTVVGKPEAEKKSDEQLINSRRRINRARKELEKVVRSLPDAVKFTIISYSSDVVPWRKKLAPVNSDSRKDAIAFIEALKAEGITVTDFALEAAFEDLAVDTIYLITDGAPTHTGSIGPERPRDADALIEAILKRVKELNFLRGVRIFTLGFPEAEEVFLQNLAAENSGLYTPIQ